ncbi:MAG: hypothetical protein WDK96_02775 [Candidatus Paceibacterota bacterium]|jgi:hypothetical protein
MVIFHIIIKYITRFSIFVGLLIFLSSSVFASTQQASTTDPVCGNNIKETGEQCDNTDLSGATCSSQGFNGGTISCNISCVLNTSACTLGGGGGGGGSGISGGNNIPPISQEEKIKIIKIADFNKDGKVDIIDLSILLYHYQHPELTDYTMYDLNDDAVVDIVDISIMFYYWSVTL